jgi:hypothetical protein
MSYADTLLSDGERVTMRARQHWLAVVLDSRWGILSLVIALILLWLGAGPLAKGDNGGIVDSFKGVLGIVTLVLFVIGLGWIALTVANWLNEEYIVTNRRVLKVEGLLNKHSADSSLEKINDAVLDQNIIGRMLNYGDLDIITANESEVDRYKMLARVIAFKKEMLNQKHELEFEQMRPPVAPPLRATPPPAVPPQPMTMSGESVPSVGASVAGPVVATATGRSMTPAEVTQTLNGLADLRDRGAISPDEYEAKKADLLGRL